MSLIASKNTLRHQLARAVCTKRNMGWVSTRSTAEAVNDRLHGYTMSAIRPEEAAQTFYLLQHAMAVIRQRFGTDEPMGEAIEIVELYHQKAGELAQRVFLYMLLICVREARHAVFEYHHLEDIENKFGEQLRDFVSELTNHKESDDGVYQFTNDAPEVDLETFCDCFRWVYYNAEFSSSYGGELWGEITDVLYDFIVGKLSPEMLLDTAFTLAHNGGPIFNKGFGFMTFDCEQLMCLLDVQASGQMPQLIESIGSYHSVYKMVWGGPQQLFGKIKKILGDGFGGWIDWYRVAEESNDSGSRWASLKEQQLTLFGEPEWVVQKKAERLEKQKKAEEAEKMEAKAKLAVDAAAKAAHQLGKEQFEKQYIAYGKKEGEAVKKESRHG